MNIKNIGTFNDFDIYTTVTSFDPESLFTVKALHLLEASGIPLMGELDRYTEQIQNALNLTPESDNPNAVALLKSCPSDPKGISPTWKNFVGIIRQLGLEHLSQQTETYLSTPQVEQLPELGARDTDSAEGDQMSLTYIIIGASFKLSVPFTSKV